MTGVAGRGRRRIVVVGMALCAGDSGVHAGQRPVSVNGVIELGVEPVCGGVTDGAIVRKVELNMRRIFTAVEVGLMASNACCRRAFEYVVEVARCARERCMRATESIAGHLQVIEFGIEPRVHGVA